MVRNDLTAGSKKRSSYKASTRARVLPQCFTFSQSPNHTTAISLIFWALLWLKAPVTLRHAFVYFARLSVTHSMEVFTKKCHRDLFKHQQTDLNRPKSTGKALCKPRNKDRKNGNKDRNCCPYSRKHGKRHVESRTEAVSFLAKPNIHQMAKSGKDKWGIVHREGDE